MPVDDVASFFSKRKLTYLTYQGRRYIVPGRPDADPRDLTLADITAIETAVPGLCVYCRSRKEHFDRRLRNLLRAAVERGDPRSLDIHDGVHSMHFMVPHHGAWMLTAEPEDGGIRDTVFDLISMNFDVERAAPVGRWTSAPGMEDLLPGPPETSCDWLKDFGKEDLEARGRQVVARLIERGLVREVALDEFGRPMGKMLDILRPHQARAILTAAANPWLLCVAPAGRGKTLIGLVASAAWGGDAVILGPAKARKAWRDQAPRYLCVDVHEMKPKSERRKSDKDADVAAYVARCRSENRPAIVSVGSESLPDYMPELMASGIRIRCLFIDEPHELANPKRYSKSTDMDGALTFELALAKSETRVKRSVAAMWLSRQNSIMFRGALDATPMSTGKPRRLYAIWDLLDPRGMGAYWDFAAAYCAAGENPNTGHWSDDGAKDLDVLARRGAWMMMEVSRAESSAGMPPMTIEMIWLEVDEQDDVKGGLRELNRMAKLASGGKTTKNSKVVESWEDCLDDEDAADFEELGVTNPNAALEELRGAEACERKRSAVVDLAVEHLVEPRMSDDEPVRKVVIFTARRRQCELWAKEIAVAVRKAGQGDAGYDGPKIAVWWAHGGVSEDERDNILDAYVRSDVPSVLITTLQAMGTSKDGMQVTTRGIIAQITANVGLMLEQGPGRFDRYGGVGTEIFIVGARETVDEDKADKLVEGISRVRQLLAAEHLADVDEKLLGLPSEKQAADDVMSVLGLTDVDEDEEEDEGD